MIIATDAQIKFNVISESVAEITWTKEKERKEEEKRIEQKAKVEKAEYERLKLKYGES